MNKFITYTHQILGDFTSQTAIEYRTFLTTLVEKGTINFSLDFSKVNDVDVVGINTLAMMYKLLRSKGGSMTIKLKKESQLSKMLHLTKFEKIFTLIYP